MIQKTTLFFLLISTHIFCYSQRSELGFFAGGSYYIGDLNPYKPYNCTHLAGGIFYRKNINLRYAYRIGLNYGNVSASDSKSNVAYHQNRNLHFKSRIIELGAIIEMNFIKYEPGRIDKFSYSPYLFTGLTYFNMNPMASLNGEWYDLQPLGTEGQGSSLNTRKKYNTNQVAIPLGIGFKYNLNKRLTFALEYGIRKTFTDYLDDVSGNYVNNFDLLEQNGVLAAHFADQSINPENGYIAPNTGKPRGNSNNKDWYSFSGITITIALGNPNTCSFQKAGRN